MQLQPFSHLNLFFTTPYIRVSLACMNKPTFITFRNIELQNLWFSESRCIITYICYILTWNDLHFLSQYRSQICLFSKFKLLQISLHGFMHVHEEILRSSTLFNTAMQAAYNMHLAVPIKKHIIWTPYLKYTVHDFNKSYSLNRPGFPFSNELNS